MNHRPETKTSARSTLLAIFSIAALAVAVVFGGVGLALWPAFSWTHFWYPESNPYQIWMVTLVGLAIFAQVVRDREPGWRLVADGVWLLAIATMVAALLLLDEHLFVEQTTGDLFGNYLEGARRSMRGAAVYDGQGLTQGVNASPVALSLIRPLAGLTNQQALKVVIVADGLALVAYLLWGSLLVKRLKGRVTVPDVGVLLGAVVCFFSFQRSWRLGQLDTLLLALLTGALTQLAGHPRRRRLTSGLLAGVATALKVVPVVVALPFVVRSFGQGAAREKRMGRRWLLAFLGVGATLLITSALVVGPGPVVDFIVNAGQISEGSTSGNNYAMVARIATFGDYLGRQVHEPLHPLFVWLGRAVSIGSLAGLLLFTWRFRHAPPAMLFAIWLSFVPFVSPVCWDIYLIWCFVLPWIVVWATVTGPGWNDTSRLRAVLTRVCLIGSYVLAGTTGNNTYTDLHSHISVNLHLPLWWEELPLVGHILLVLSLLSVTFHLERITSDP